MGLGVYLVGTLKAGTNRHDLLTQIQQESPLVTVPELRDLLTSDFADERLYVTLHPLSESAEFFFDDDQRLICSAKTNTCGPGYHAYLVDWLERLGARVGIDWKRNQPEGFGDETSYFVERNFETLQEEMYAWLKAICDILAESRHEEYKQLAVCMSLNGPRLSDSRHDTVTPLGPRDWAWYEQAKEDRACAAEFFCWWNRAADAEFWRKTALYFMWCEVSWSPVQSDGQYELYQTTLNCCEVALELDPLCAIPTDAKAELEELLAGQLSDDDVLLNMTSDRIGYCRRQLTRPLTGHWTVELPGYYYFQFDEEDGTCVYYFGGRTVRLSTFVFERDGQSPAGLEAIGTPNPLQPGEELIDDRHLEPPALAKLSWYEDEDEDDSYWLLSGRVGGGGGLCAASICYTDPDDKQWAIATLRSLKPPPANAQE